MQDEVAPIQRSWLGRRPAIQPAVEPVRSSALGRVYLDTLLSSLCFILLRIAVGGIWRPPFDDEMDAITAIKHFGPLQMFREMWGVHFHPPTFYAVFSLLYQIVPALPFLRLFALICSAGSIFLVHQMFLNVGSKPAIEDRVIAILAFATIPLLFNWGDAIRWYPIFVLLFAFLIVTLARRPNATWVLAGLLCALSLVNIEGYLITAAVILYRYLIERRRITIDLKFLTITAFLQLIPVPYYYAIFMMEQVQSHLHSTVGVKQYYELIVGFFDGCTFGIGLIWVLLPIFVLTGLALLRLIQRVGEMDALERFSLVIFGLTVAMASLWTYPYCFIYAALILTYVVLKMLSRTRAPAAKLAVMSAFLVTNGAAIGNLRGSDHPFWRTYPAPYREMAAAISRNFAPGDLVVSTDINVVTLLDPRVDCVRVFELVVRSGADCPLKGGTASQLERRPARVLLVEGRRNLVQLYNTRNINKGPWEAVVSDLTADRRLLASIPYSYDADAALKTRLSGERLEPFVFSIKIFE
jgi:hypothetical protein